MKWALNRAVRKRSASDLQQDSETRTDSIAICNEPHPQRDMEANSSPRDQKVEQQAKRTRFGELDELQHEKDENPGCKPDMNTNDKKISMVDAALVAGVLNSAPEQASCPVLGTMSSAISNELAGKGAIAQVSDSQTYISSGKHAEYILHERGNEKQGIAEQDVKAFMDFYGSKPIPREVLQYVAQTGGSMTLLDLIHQLSEPRFLRASISANLSQFIYNSDDHLAMLQSSLRRGDAPTQKSNTSVLETFSVANRSSDWVGEGVQDKFAATRQAGSTREASVSGLNAECSMPSADVPIGSPVASLNHHQQSLYIQLSTGPDNTTSRSADRSDTPIPSVSKLVSSSRSDVEREKEGGAVLRQDTVEQSLLDSTSRMASQQGKGQSANPLWSNELLNNSSNSSTLYCAPNLMRKGSSKSPLIESRRSLDSKGSDSKPVSVRPDRLLTCRSTAATSAFAKTASGELALSRGEGSEGGAVILRDAPSRHLRISPAPLDPVTPEKAHGLLYLVSQLAVFADGGKRGRWCATLDYTDCAAARALFRKGLELQRCGTNSASIDLLLRAQSLRSQPSRDLESVLATVADAVGRNA